MTTSNPGDPRSLLDRARANDAQAFAALARRHGVALLLFLKRRGQGILGGDCSEEDLLQLVLARAWQALPKAPLLLPEQFHVWLLAFCKTALSDRRKYVQAKGRNSIVQPESPGMTGLGWSILDHATSVGGRAALREEAEHAAAAVLALPEPQRVVVERFYVEGESLSVIARALGITKNAAWERLHRGMKTLREKLHAATPSPT